MAIHIAVAKETQPNEHRIAITPDVAKKLKSLGVALDIEKGLGSALGFADESFDAKVHTHQEALVKDANIVVKIHPPVLSEISLYPKNSIVLCYGASFGDASILEEAKKRDIMLFSLEKIPRISRAQSMDVLSSQAAAAGYKAALMGADMCQKFFPMLTTAAGTLRPANVLVIGAGVAGLQAISTARRLGAIVEAYDVRSATKEQVQSLGAKFIELPISAEGEGGYARQLSVEEKQQQQEKLAEHVAKADVVITTAAVPGKPAPKIITKAMVEKMRGGSAIIDLGAETGGNCELTKPNETIQHHDVFIVGAVNLPSHLSVHASEMYAKNILNFLQLILKDSTIQIDRDDEIIKDCLLVDTCK